MSQSIKIFGIGQQCRQFNFIRLIGYIADGVGTERINAFAGAIFQVKFHFLVKQNTGRYRHI